MTSNDNLCALDVRLFMLTLVLSMLGAFYAGVSYELPHEWLDRLHAFASSYLTTTKAISTPLSPELSNVSLYESLKHSPSGQHLLVDIKGIESSFLDSEERLSDAMVRTVQAGGLSLLSYHCHKLDPMGVSCVGILLESHISFHTWPEEGVITLDLFTCGANPLIPVVPVIEELFGIGENIETKWAHELRGFRSAEEKKKNYLDNFSDLSIWILSPIEITSKTLVYSNMTKYQRVDIWDLAEPENTPTYEDGKRHNIPDGDPRWLDTHYYTPDRVLFLDGVLQSLTSHERNYHEALVHPAMFAHPNPQYIGIIGGGEGATLREVLKHKTVKHVTMIEIDGELIQIAREHLAQMSDCSNLIGRAENCFDDEIVDVVAENSLKWFVDRYGPNAEKDAPTNPFDVIIVDALDPEDEVPFNTDLYVDPAFVGSIMKSLSSDGVIMIQIGTAPELLDHKADLTGGTYEVREKLFHLFEGHPDVAAMHVYEEPNSGYLEPHSFLVVCKHVNCRSRWYARNDEIDYEIYNRVVQTTDGKEALRAFDGITQHIYQAPTMAWEAVYCRREPTPFECRFRSLDFSKEIHEFELYDKDSSSFSVVQKKNDEGEVIGSSVIATVDIPKGSYIMPDHLSRSLVFTEDSVQGVNVNAKNEAHLYDSLAQFIEGNAHKSHTVGSETRYMEVGASVLIREVEDDNEANVGRWVPIHPSGKRPVYSPVYDRHRMSFDVFMVATKDIRQGEELTRSKGMWT